MDKPVVEAATEKAVVELVGFDELGSSKLPTELINVIPSGVIINLIKVFLSPQSIPRRVIYSPSLFPNGVILSYRYSCNHHPSRNEEFSSFNVRPGFNFPAPVKDLFS